MKRLIIAIHGFTFRALINITDFSVLATNATTPPPSGDGRKPEGALRRWILALCFIACGWQTLAALDPAALQRQLIASFGPARVTLLKDWLQTVNSAKSLGEQARLTQINNFINHNIAFEDDLGIW